MRNGHSGDRAQALVERLRPRAMRLGVDARAAAARRSRAGASRGSRRRSPCARRSRPRRRSTLEDRAGSRSSTSIPPSSSTATSSSRRLTCQSWLPSTVSTGTSSVAHASARIARLLGLAVRGQVAGEQEQVDAAAQRARRPRAGARGRRRAPQWMSPGGGDADAAARPARAGASDVSIATAMPSPAYPWRAPGTPRMELRRAAVLGHRGDAEEGRGRAARRARSRSCWAAASPAGRAAARRRATTST